MEAVKRQKVIQDAINGNVAMAAKTIFAKEGVHPCYWGISKYQFKEFVDKVRDEYYLKERIVNDPEHNYPPDIFNDKNRGPNMHQVCEQIIKVETRDSTVLVTENKKKLANVTKAASGDWMFKDNPEVYSTINIPFLSYSMQQNIYSAGLRCDVFFSHAWNEPFFEAAKHILDAWPKDCRGAYICCLSNPQHLDITELLGTSIPDSPFYRILRNETSPPRELLMVANSRTPIHQRLWCVLEAHVALIMNISRVKVSGRPHYLLMTDDAERIKIEIDPYLEQIKPLIDKAESLAARLSDGDIHIKHYWEDAQDIFNNFYVILQPMKDTVIKILDRPVKELINIQMATASKINDELNIRKFIKGKEQEICKMVGGLLCDNMKILWKEFVGASEKALTDTQESIVKQYAGFHEIVPVGKGVKDRYDSRAGLRKRVQTACHVLPIGIVQVCDYISDAIVIGQLYRNGSTMWIFAVSAIIVSWLLGWLAVMIVLPMQPNKKAKLALLVPLNLHTLYYGLSEDCEGLTVTLLKYYETVSESVMLSLIAFGVLIEGDVARDRTLFIVSFVLSVLSTMYSYGLGYIALCKVASRKGVDSDYVVLRCFDDEKMINKIALDTLEALENKDPVPLRDLGLAFDRNRTPLTIGEWEVSPLGMMSSLVRDESTTVKCGGDEEEDYITYVDNNFLMVNGEYVLDVANWKMREGNVINCIKSSCDDKERTLLRGGGRDWTLNFDCGTISTNCEHNLVLGRGRKAPYKYNSEILPLPIMFCTLLNVLYMIVVFGSVIGLAPENQGWYILALFWFVNGNCVLLFTMRSASAGILVKLILFPGLSVFAMMETPLLKCFLGRKDDTNYENDIEILSGIILRRVTLMCILIYAILLSTSPTLIAVLIILFAVDILSCIYMLSYFLEDEWVFMKWLKCALSETEDAVKHTPLVIEMNNSENSRNHLDPGFSSTALLVMLDAILLEYENPSNALVQICEEIKGELVKWSPRLSLATRAGALQALHTFVPNKSKQMVNGEIQEIDNSEGKLTQALQDCVKSGFVPDKATDVFQSINEPLRAMPLAKVQYTHNHLASLVLSNLAPKSNECDYFLSHVQDGQHESQAMHIVINYLFVSELMSHVTIVSFIISIFMVPFGFAIASEIPWVPSWLFVVIVIFFWALTVIWVLLAKHTSLIPQQLCPWVLSKHTLWIDRYCRNHKSKASMCSIGYFVAQSNNMIAVVNKEYFSNLRSVFELAIFCKIHQHSELGRRLVLISSEWCKIWWFHKTFALMPEEEKWLAEFRCDKARCAVPTERLILVSAIRDMWGSLTEFEAFVRTDLLYVFKESKKQNYYRSQEVIKKSFENVFVP